jgi:hypothetical protein
MQSGVGTATMTSNGGIQLLAVNVTLVLSELLARNRGHDPLDPDRRQPPDYGVSASLEAGTLEVVLTFRSGATYCCYEPGCHVRLHNGHRWDELRRVLAAHGITAPLSLELRLTCVVEEGAVFFDFAKPDVTRRGWYAFHPVVAHRFQVFAAEAGRGDT